MLNVIIKLREKRDNKVYAKEKYQEEKKDKVRGLMASVKGKDKNYIE